MNKWFSNDIMPLDVIKEGYWSIGQKVDFVLDERWDNAHIKVTIKAIAEYEHASKTYDIYDRFVTGFDITDITEESLELEPVYVCRCEVATKIGHLNFRKGDIFGIPESFLNMELTKEAVDEYFGFYLEVEMQTYNKYNYSSADDIKKDIITLLEERDLSPKVRQLDEYDEDDVDSILYSLYYYLDIPRNETTRADVINLLRGATKKEVFTNPKNNRKYEVMLDTEEHRTVVAYALNVINRKKYTFKY